LLNAVYFLPLLLSGNNRANLDIVAQGKWLHSLRALCQIPLTLCLTVLAWIFFRAESVSHAVSYIKGIFSETLFSVPEEFPKYLVVLLVFFLGIEWLGREGNYGIGGIDNVKSRLLRWGFYILIIFLIFSFMATEETPFIYFQF